MLLLLTLSDGEEVAVNADAIRTIMRSSRGYTEVMLTDGGSLLVRQTARDITDAERAKLGTKTR